MSDYKKARVSGDVSYLNEKGQRVGVPKGPCEFSDNKGFGPFKLKWVVGGEFKEIELTLHEFAQYSGTKQFVVLD